MSESHLQDLQSILRSQLGDNVIVETYVTKDLLPPGENYGSKLVSVHARIKGRKNEKSEDLYLVAKLPPVTEFQREMFDTPFTFRKEISMYAEILPFYRQLEMTSGVREGELLDISPRYYGSRLSMKPDSEFDDNAAILLENLKIRGFYCIERRLGCDLIHARLAVKAMAKFHALGMATKEKDPEFFETLKLRSKCLEMKNTEHWEKWVGRSIQNIADTPEIGEFYEPCVKTIQSIDPAAWTAVPKEPWSTIIHADFWANNFLFHRNEAGEPDDIKFIDYQNYLFLRPTRELAFFFGTGLSHETTGNVDELLDLYYNTLIDKLRMLDCDVKPYSRETFDEVLREDGHVEFIHCLFMVRVLTMDVDSKNVDEFSMRNIFEGNDCGAAYRSRLRDFVSLFHERGWLLN